MKIRASIGTAAVLGLEKILLQAKPTTAYLLMYSESPCLSNCSFCPQARESTGRRDELSRVLWPDYDLNLIIERLSTLKTGIKRICIQTVRYENSTEELLEIIRNISEKKIPIPVTVCCYPTTKEIFSKMKNLGVRRVGISFDCATPEIYEEIKGKKRGIDISWDQMEKSIQDAVEVFGNRFVSTHLIIGLGETEKEAVQFLQKFYDLNITVGLFAFTPVKGTVLEKKLQPELDSYRRIQLARYLINTGKTSLSKITFETKDELRDRILNFGVKEEEIEQILTYGKPFRTSGCPHCNRPFYNESPGKDLYNFPVELAEEDIVVVRKSLKDFF
ncbi:MAG: radical SAM protein [Asgard group archaeon]|nr:radical SAM protein [Asgard group archaeon]